MYRGGVFFHAWPEQFYAELIHRFCSHGVLDRTVGSGYAAMATIKAKKTYVGLCLSDAHKDLLEQWLQWLIFNEMQDSNSSLHDASLSLLTRSGDEKQKKRKLEEAQVKKKLRNRRPPIRSLTLKLTKVPATRAKTIELPPPVHPYCHQ